MQSRPILITGARGFVGTWLRPALEAAMPGVEIVGTSSASRPEAGLRSLEMGDHKGIRALVSELRPAAIVNLAAFSVIQEAEAEPAAAFEVNTLGPWSLARAALEEVPDCRFLFIGSSEIYGGTFKAWGRALDESAPLDPMNLYASAKAAGDLLIGQLSHQGLNAIRFRPFNHTGPGQSARFALAAFIAQIDRIERGLQEPVISVGNLDAERDFIDVRDVVTAYVAALTRPEPLPAGTVLNLASGMPWRIGTLLEMLLAQARVPIQVARDPSRMRASETPLVVGDASRAQALLGWSPRYGIEQTLQDMLAYVRGQFAPSDAVPMR